MRTAGSRRMDSRRFWRNASPMRLGIRLAGRNQHTYLGRMTRNANQPANASATPADANIN